MFGYIQPDSTIKTVGVLANGASTILKRTNSMIIGRSYGYNVSNDNDRKTAFVSDFGSIADPVTGH